MLVKSSSPFGRIESGIEINCFKIIHIWYVWYSSTKNKRSGFLKDATSVIYSKKMNVDAQIVEDVRLMLDTICFNENSSRGWYDVIINSYVNLLGDVIDWPNFLHIFFLQKSKKKNFPKTSTKSKFIKLGTRRCTF